MPRVSMFNPKGRELTPPRPINFDDDPDIPRLRIIVVPPGNFLPAEPLSNIPLTLSVAPAINGGPISIPADDAQSVRLANGTVATPVNDILIVPQFFDHTAFPEPTIVEVEAPVIDPIAAPNDDAPVATGTPHAMTAAEKQALEQEIEQLEEARRLRLREVHIGPPNEPEVTTNVARSMEPPPPMTNPRQSKS